MTTFEVNVAFENLGTEHPFSCCYEQPFAITWKASPTYISPPICTPTQGSLIRTISRAVSAASQLEIHDTPILATAFTSRLRRTNRMNACNEAQVRCLDEQRFESARGFDVSWRCHKFAAAFQNILRNGKAADASGRFGSASSHYVDK